MAVDLDAATQEEYASVSKLLKEFTDIPTIDKAWAFKSESEDVSRAMFLIGQPNLLSNERRKSILSSHIFRKSNSSVSFHWAPFPIERNGVSTMVPSPSGSKLLVIRNSEGLRAFHGIQMKLLLLMLLRNPILPNLHLMLLAIKKRVVQIRTVAAGRVKVTGKGTGENRMLGKGSRPFLLSTF
jgi:hypothetical protein